MGGRLSSFSVDADEPQPYPDQMQPGADPATQQPGDSAATARGRPHRPPPLNLSAPPAPAPQRRRVPICSAVDTVDIATTYPQSPMASPAATALVDVWILAGQSNMVGDNAADGTPIPAASQPLPGLVLSYDSSGTWRDAVPNIHHNIHGYTREPSCGPGLAFGRTLISLGLSTRVGLIPTAKGSTSLFRDWRPGGGGGGAELYPAMIARAKAALSAPLPGGGTCRLRGMIWIQGEADAEERAGPKPSESYGANFAAFANAVRRDLSYYHGQLPILLGVMSVRKRDCFPYIGAVRHAQLGLSLPHLLTVDLAGFEFFEEYGGFHVHLTKDGCTALGTAMAHAYYSAVVRAGLPRRNGDALIALMAGPSRVSFPGVSSGGGGGGGASGGGGDAGNAAAAPGDGATQTGAAAAATGAAAAAPESGLRAAADVRQGDAAAAAGAGSRSGQPSEPAAGRLGPDTPVWIEQAEHMEEAAPADVEIEVEEDQEEEEDKGEGWRPIVGSSDGAGCVAAGGAEARANGARALGQQKDPGEVEGA